MNIAEHPEHPFQPGTRVALRDGITDAYSEAFVEKVYKNGNFTLRGNRQQWRPHSEWRKLGDPSAGKKWIADSTYRGYHRDRVLLWDAETDNEIQEHIARTQRSKRLSRLQDTFRYFRVGDVTDAMLDQIEALLISRAPSS